MSGAAVVNILIGIALAVWIISRQLRTRPVNEDSAARLILILGVIGVVEMAGAARGHAVGDSALAGVIAGLVLAGGLSVWRASTVEVWRDAAGSAWRRGTVATAALWIVAIAAHIVIDVWIDHADKAATSFASASILLYLAVSLGVQRELLRTRAARIR